MLHLVQLFQSVLFSFAQRDLLRFHRALSPPESGHFDFAQTGHSHFAAKFRPNSLLAGLEQRMMRKLKVCVPEYKQNCAPREELKSKERRIVPGSFAQSLVNFV